MVLPVDNIAFQIVSVVGLSLPVFVFAVDAFSTDKRGRRTVYSKELVSTAMGLLILSALLSLGALLAPPKGQGDMIHLLADDSFIQVIRYGKNILVDVSTVLLAVGYVGLWWSLCNILGIDPPIADPSKKLLQHLAGAATLVVLLLNGLL